MDSTCTPTARGGAGDTEDDWAMSGALAGEVEAAGWQDAAAAPAPAPDAAEEGSVGAAEEPPGASGAGGRVLRVASLDEALQEAERRVIARAAVPPQRRQGARTLSFDDIVAGVCAGAPEGRAEVDEG